MAKVTSGIAGQTTDQEKKASEAPESHDVVRNDPLRSGEQDSGGLETALLPHEKELLREVMQGLRAIRYGSIVLTVHEGRIVEIEKTVRIRKNRAS